MGLRINSLLLFSILAFVLFSAVATADSVTATAPTATNTTLNLGQSITFSAVVSNGIGPFNVTLIDVGQGGAPYESFTIPADGTVTFDGFEPGYSDTYYILVTDMGATPSYNFSSGSTPITVNPALTAPTISASSQTINSGQSVTLVAAGVSGGTPPYSYQWYSDGNCTTQIAGQTLNSTTQYPSSTTTYSVQVTDSVTTPVPLCSPGVTITVNQTVVQVTTVATTISSGGGGGGGGGGSGTKSGSPGVLTIAKTGSNIYTISNITQSSTFSVSLGSAFDVTENFITPTSAGITLNGAALTLLQDDPVLIFSNTTSNVFIQLTEINATPVLHTITLQIVSQQASPPSINATVSSTSIPAPTTTAVSIVQEVTNFIVKVQQATSPLLFSRAMLEAVVAAVIIIVVATLLYNRFFRKRGRRGIGRSKRSAVAFSSSAKHPKKKAS